MESTLPIQCDEISSTVPDDPQNDNVAVVNELRLEQLRREHPGKAKLIEIAIHMIGAAGTQEHHVEYHWRDETHAFLIVNGHNVDIFGHTPGFFDVIFHQINYDIRIVTPMSLIKMAGFFLKSFFVACNYRLHNFYPASAKLSEMFTVPRKLKVHRLHFDCSKQDAEEIMDTWVPHFENIDILRIQGVHNMEHQERCLRIYHKHFHGKVKVWRGAVPVTTANALRRLMPFSILDGDQTPIGVVMRWIKGWLTGSPGYTQIKGINYRNPRYASHTGLVRFLGHPIDVPSSDGVYNMRVNGEVAYIRFKDGRMIFALCSDPTHKFFENSLTLKFGCFNVDDLEDDDVKWTQYLGKDQIDYQNVEDYGTPIPESPQA